MELDTPKTKPARYDQILKRVADFAISLPLALVFLPICLVVAIAIRIDSPGPLLYRQKRVGRLGVPFSILKFRTMRHELSTYGPSVTAEDDERITRLGHILRRSKLDELPQLLNVILGDMSLVGPRPQVQRFVDLYDPRLREMILSVRPGVTGLTALCFRNEERLLAQSANREEYYVQHLLPIKEELDAWYVGNRNVFRDTYILFVTAWLLTGPPIGRRLHLIPRRREDELAGRIVARYARLIPSNHNQSALDIPLFHEAEGILSLKD